MRPELPTGTVTYLFTDIEGSTRLLHTLGPAGYAQALAEHRVTLREALATGAGVEVDTQGDAFFCAFPTADGAARAAMRAQEALEAGPLSVRMGLHTGSPTPTDEGYVGIDVNRGARVAALAAGGQIVCSPQTAALLTGRCSTTSACTGQGLRRRDEALPARRGRVPAAAQPRLGRAPHARDPLRGPRAGALPGRLARVRARPEGAHGSRPRGHGKDPLRARAGTPARGRGRGRDRLLRARAAARAGARALHHRRAPGSCLARRHCDRRSHRRQADPCRGRQSRAPPPGRRALARRARLGRSRPPPPRHEPGGAPHPGRGRARPAARWASRRQ